MAQRLKCLPPMQETRVWSLGQEDPLEKEMATHSSILAWRNLWTEEPGGLQSTGSQRVGHDWAISLTHSKCSFRFLYSILWKNLNELFGQPSIMTVTQRDILTHQLWDRIAREYSKMTKVFGLSNWKIGCFFFFRKVLKWSLNSTHNTKMSDFCISVSTLSSLICKLFWSLMLCLKEHLE